MNANKIKNGVIALIKEACLRLRLEPIEFMRLYEQVSGREQPALTFASCCLHLEKNPTDSKLRTLLQSPEKFSFAIGSTDDNCYSLLYDMVTAFYTNSPTSFFVRAARFEAPPLMVLSRGVPTADGVSEVKCTVCGQSMFNTTSGWVCDNGHGGAEDPLNPKTWELDLEAMLRHADPGPVRRETNSEDVSGVIAASDIVKEQDRRRQDIEFGGEAPERKYDPVARPTIPWNDDQNKAFKSVWRWLNDPRKKPIFRMFGFAGTGKTSMAKEIAWVVENGEGVPRGLVLFAAYSGKAAAVLRSKGCTSATTIHSLIYKPQIDRDTGQVTGFTRNGESPLRDCALLIVDEVSMVNEEMAMDLMSYGVAILVLGDPGQLKPIKGEGYFTQSREDIMLTSVERI
jgi:hypothetical protein